MTDVEGLIAWLRDRGYSDQQLAAYRHFIAELGKHPSLSAALRAAEEAGATPRQIANLRETAARIVEFEEAQRAPAAAPAASTKPVSAGSAAPAAAATAKPAAVAAVAAALDIEAKPARAAPSSYARGMEPIRRGCACSRRHEVYLDTDFGALASMLGGGIGIGTLILLRMFGVLGTVALALGLAGIGGLITTLMICLRCEGCRRRVSDLDDDERAHVRKGRSKVALVTAGLLAGSAVAGFLWWSAIKSAYRDAEQERLREYYENPR